MSEEPDDVLRLLLEKDTFTVAKELAAKHAASKHDSKDVKIRDSYFSFNLRDFQHLLEDYTSMRKLLRSLDIDVQWKEPPRKKRTRLSDSDPIPTFVKPKRKRERL